MSKSYQTALNYYHVLFYDKMKENTQYLSIAIPLKELQLWTGNTPRPRNLDKNGISCPQDLQKIILNVDETWTRECFQPYDL